MRKIIKGKKGSTFTHNEMLGLVLAGACLIILAVLLFMLISPYFSKKDETLKSYFQSFNQNIIKTNGGEFMIYQDDDVYLVYFGNRSVYGLPGESWRFSLKKPFNNMLCFCRKSDAVNNKACKTDFCTSLGRPAVLIPNFGEDFRFAVGINEKLLIRPEEDKYVFEKPYSYFAVSQGSGVTDIYFKFVTKWMWSPDKQNWMLVPGIVVSGGEYDGKMPVQKNIEIIQALENKNLEQGLNILKINSASLKAE